MSDKKRPLTGLLSDLANAANDLLSHNAAMMEGLTRDLNSGTGINPDLMRVPGAPEPGFPTAGAPAASTGRKKIDPAFMSLAYDFGAYPRPTAPAPAQAAPVAAKPAQAAPTPDPQTPPAPPTLDALWKTADETIDWTEILSGAAIPQVDEKKLAIYTQNAEAVLRGDQDAYLTVLHTADPMADLMSFVTSLDVSAQSADDMRAVYGVRADLQGDDPRRYLSAVALRIARDLFAVLPVTNVTVEARDGDQARLQVSFQRRELHKVRFAFIDPAEFVAQCGGEFTLPEA